MEQEAPVISSISPRSPRKICGLFDIGFPGGALDVTSLDLTAPETGNPYSLGGLNSFNFSTSDHDSGSDFYGEGKLESVQQYTMDTFDMLEPLADLETDQLMDDSLDAFINLEQYLIGDTFFDETAEVKPFIDVPTIDNINMTLTTPNAEFVLPSEPDAPKSRKRKAEPEPLKVPPLKISMLEIPVNIKSVKTSLFEIPVNVNVVADPQLDHDYTTKLQKKSGDSQKINSNGNKKGKAVAKTAVSHCEPSTSSSDNFSFLEEIVTDKQAVRRLKNNVASKKSREQRKQKFADLDDEAEKLIQANEELKLKIVELEKLAKEMKAALVAKMTGK